LPRFARPAPQGAKLATSAKKRPSVAAETDPKEERELVEKGQEWTALGLSKRGIGCGVFQLEWRRYFVEHGNNGRPLPDVLRDFLLECARMRLPVPVAFERAAREQDGIREDHTAGN
jgi:hypothetical protein